MTEPQRYAMDHTNIMSTKTGPYVTFADAKAWVEREVAAARADERLTMEAPQSYYTKGYEAGKSAGLAKGIRRCADCPEVADDAVVEWVTYADAKAWVDILTAESNGWRVKWMRDTEVCRKAGYEQGQRDERARIRAGVENFHRGSCRWYYTERRCTCGLHDTIDGTATQDGES
jgi:hypothetical protein